MSSDENEEVVRRTSSSARRRKTIQIEDHEDEDEDEEEGVAGPSGLVPQPSTTLGSDVMGQPSDDDDEEEEVVVVKRSRGSQGEAPKPAKDEKTARQSARLKGKGGPVSSSANWKTLLDSESESEGGDEEEEEETATGARKSKGSRGKQPPPPRHKKPSWVGRPSRTALARLSREGKWSDDSAGSSDLDDFIARSDEEEDEEEEVAKPRAKGARSSRSRPRRSSSGVDDFIVEDDVIEMLDDTDDDDDARPASKARKKSRGSAKEKKKKRKGSSSNKRHKEKKKKKEEEEEEESTGGPKRRKIVLESDEEEEGDEGSQGTGDEGGSGSSDEGGESEGSDEEEDEDDDASSVDEATLHRRHFALQALEEDEALPLFMTRKSLTLREAFTSFVEMLARCAVDASFLHGIGTNPQASAYGKYTCARKVVEDLLCTRRESLLGSMAWTPEVVRNLRSLPHYSAFGLPSYDRPTKCDVCNRSRHPCANRIVLWGTRYEGLEVWTAARWDRFLPCPIKRLGERDWEDKDKAERVEYSSGSTCCGKTRLYHGMFHYKLKLLCRVCRKLQADHRGDDVKGLLNDHDWLEMEFDRLENIMQHVEGLMQEDRGTNRLPERSIWSSDDEAPQLRQTRLDNFTSQDGRRTSRGYNPYSDEEEDDEEEEEEYGL